MVQIPGLEQALKDRIVDARRTGDRLSRINGRGPTPSRSDQPTVVQYKGEEFTAYSHDLVEGGAQQDQLNKDEAQMMTILSQYEAILKKRRL